MQARLVFVEQFFFPEGWGGAELPRDLTVFLAGRGFDVEVICGSDQYVTTEGDPGIDPTSLGVRIRRVRSVGGGARRTRLLRQIWFYLALVPMLVFRKRPELFLVQTNPPLAVFLVAMAARCWRTPMVIIAMDLYPEVAEAHGMVNAGSVVGRALRRIFRWSYRVAHQVVSLGPVMTDRLISKGVAADRIAEISNWSTGAPGVVRGAENSLRFEWRLENQFVLLYSGNLGIGHEFQTLLRGVELARRSMSNLRLVIIGSGSRLIEVRDLVAELRLSDIVRFSKFLPAAMLADSLGVADLGLVTLRPGFEGLVVPSKILSYMARGIPVLYIGPISDVDAYLDWNGRGVVLRNGDVVGVARALIELHADPKRLAALGEKGKRYYDDRLAREHGLARYEAVIRSCLVDS